MGFQVSTNYSINFGAINFDYAGYIKFLNFKIFCLKFKFPNNFNEYLYLKSRLIS